ncbi:hypothetical protein LVO79_01150 [Roseivivax marinus]|uniref:hypothetical protein n=1 Tax=Roseivivax marinus TaxID=1379903 RepID=UPI001F042303|nr:hypothetical protein [Roseivivax marinus]UMA65116.1 hypothetical protein LVO79_01150 [Roseivivax marinus]
MQHDWIIDVLSDLRDFAQQNDLSALAAQINDVTIVAHIEIASKTAKELTGGLPLVHTVDRKGVGRFGVG